MYTFTNDELRALTSKELISLKKEAKSGDSTAIYKMAMCILYAQAEDFEDDMQKYLSSEEVAKDEMALLLRGYSYEHAIGTTKNYAKAVECYSKAYDLLNNIHSSGKEVKDSAKAQQEIEKIYDKLTKNVGQVIAIKKFCQFKEGQFLFPWTAETRSSLGKLLPQLSNDVADFGELFAKAITNLKDETHGEWEFRYQDTLLMPVEVMKALAARDYFEHYLKDNGFQIIPADPYFNNALGRCLIDDDDAYDNDYIISGLLNMAGHEGDALWQYRVGLWYEYCDNNLEPKTAAYWYEQAKNGTPAAKIALERIKESMQYRILENSKEGTAKECQSLMTRSSKNPQNSVSWLIEKALRGDESAMQRIEHNQFAPKGNTSIFNQTFTLESIQPFYTLLKEEASADQKVKKGWNDLMQKEKDEYRKRVEEEERRRKEAERKRLETERKAEEERIRKIKEAEEAKHRAEEEAIRKAKKAEEDRIRKAKEAEEAKRRAEEEAIRKAKEAEEEAIRKAKKAEEEAKRKAEEAKRRAEEEVREAYQQGILYYNQKKYTEAAKLFSKAAEHGHVEAQFILGLCYKDGDGVKQDYEEAVKWFRKAAEQGHAEAQFCLGACYRDGHGVDRDYKEAISWFRKAADQRSARAINAIGKRYLNGEGVSKDPVEAVKWFRKAAEQGLDMAQCNLGDCYKDGMGVDKNHKEAIKWYRKAEKQGSDYASVALEKLEGLSMGMKLSWVLALLPCLIAWGCSIVVGSPWNIGIFFILLIGAIYLFYRVFITHWGNMENSQRSIFIVQFILLILTCGIVFFF